jgi:hypothetical protein
MGVGFAVLVNWILDKISLVCCEESIDYDIVSKLSILSLNSLMIFSCGKARVKRHKLLVSLVRQCAFSL